jgi:hypothetical protein
LKENVIVGRLIPAGTGSVVARLREVAADRDRALAAIAAEAEAAEPAQITEQQAGAAEKPPRHEPEARFSLPAFAAVSAENRAVAA